MKVERKCFLLLFDMLQNTEIFAYKGIIDTWWNIFILTFYFYKYEQV